MSEVSSEHAQGIAPPLPPPASGPQAPKAQGDATTAPAATAAQAPPKKKRKWLRRFLIALGIMPVLMLLLWIAIHKIEWLGPWLADTGRAIVGNDAIAKLEDFAYGVEDKYNTTTRGDEKPEARWEVPPLPPSLVEPDSPSKKRVYPKFVPTNVGPQHKSFSAPGDGDWVPMIDPRHPDEPPPMFKTLLHPDKKRGWATVAIVAVDLAQVRLHLVAGLHEPMSKLPAAKDHKRTGLIAPDHVAIALAAFNGGFKTTHGNYGMKAEGVLWVEPRVHACTIAMYDKDELKIRAWEAVETTRDQMTWFRQTPGCLYENGEMHKGLTVEQNTMWGSTLDKSTVIRRSAIGLSEDGKILYVGISEATTATAIAKAMHHGGAHHIAQLDVNFSYPKFVTVEPRDGDAKNPTVKAIIDGFEYTEDDYVRNDMKRDFFYLTRKDPAELTAH